MALRIVRVVRKSKRLIPPLVRQTGFDDAVPKAQRVIPQPADSGGRPRPRLEVGRLRLIQRTRWRPWRVVTTIGIEAAGRWELRRVTGGQVELAAMERASDEAVIE